MRHAGDVIGEDGKVRVLSERCSTCIFRRGDLMSLGKMKFEEIVEDNIKADSLLTCHQTLPYGGNPDFGPAVCNGFWRLHGLKTIAGKIAQRIIGITYVKPPGPEYEG